MPVEKKPVSLVDQRSKNSLHSVQESNLSGSESGQNSYLNVPGAAALDGNSRGSSRGPSEYVDDANSAVNAAGARQGLPDNINYSRSFGGSVMEARSHMQPQGQVQRARPNEKPMVRLSSLRYPNNQKLKRSERIEQELTLVNEGSQAWPEDTALVFSGSRNELGVIEEVKIGALAPQCSVDVRIPIVMPNRFPADRDRYVIEYELRYSFQTIVIGAPMKLSILMIKDGSENSQSSMSSSANSPGDNSSGPNIVGSSSSSGNKSAKHNRDGHLHLAA